MGRFKTLLEQFFACFCAGNPVLGHLPEGYSLHGGLLRVAAEIILAEWRQPTDAEVEAYFAGGGKLDVVVSEPCFSYRTLTELYPPIRAWSLRFHFAGVFLEIQNDGVYYQFVFKYDEIFESDRLCYTDGAGATISHDAVQAIRGKELIPRFRGDYAVLEKLRKMLRLWEAGYRPPNDAWFGQWLKKILWYCRRNKRNVGPHGRHALLADPTMVEILTQFGISKKEKPDMGSFKILLEKFLAHFCANDPVIANLPEGYTVYGGFLRMAAEIILDHWREPTDAEVDAYLRGGGDIDIKTSKFDYSTVLRAYPHVLAQCRYVTGRGRKRKKSLGCLLVWRDHVRYEIQLSRSRATPDYAPNQLCYSGGSLSFYDAGAIDAIWNKHLMALFRPEHSNLKLLRRMARLWDLGYRPEDDAFFTVWLAAVVRTCKRDRQRHWMCDADLSEPQEKVVLRPMENRDVFKNPTMVEIFEKYKIQI
jgi:hypothetical protein